VDVSRGERIGRVSSEWFNRPDDERYLSLDDLWASVKGRSERSRCRVVETADIRVEAARDSAERLHLVLPKAKEPVAPTHWAFGQLASIVGAPASYLRQLPAPLAGINLQYGLSNHRAEQVKTFETEDGRTELRAVTGPDYGRIHDHELVEAVQRIAGNGTGDTRWKVPGVLDWSTGVYNPDVEISRDTTTLYASDRDVFLFLVDDHNPIEAGRLADGSPDLYFRGFYCWNSEVGAKTLGIARFYLRAVCQNRNLWGVEDFQEITIRHSKYAASRFAHEAAPALTRSRASGAALEANVRDIHLPVQAADLADSYPAQNIDARHASWRADMPLGQGEDVLWDWIYALDEASRQALLAHCLSFGVNALYERPNPYSGMGISQHGLDRRLREADRLARTTRLDLVEAGWKPTVANYLGRVTKSRILEAVREGVGEGAAQLIDHLKKGDMAREAERLLDGSGWLPEPLRLDDPDLEQDMATEDAGVELPAFLTGDDETQPEDEEEQQQLIAAE
jgi:hypothetical protein